MGETENEPDQTESQPLEPNGGENEVNTPAPKTEDSGGEKVSVSEDPLVALTLELQKSKDDYLRLAAEFDNYKKRTSRDFASLVKTANEGLIQELLDILDNFERAFKSREENHDPDAYHKGIQMLYDKLLGTLGREGLKRFDSVGEKFDPRLHEAVMQVDSPEKEPDTVALELQPGYLLNDKVIRHARVGVVKEKGDG